jgi:hypothetical protein
MICKYCTFYLDHNFGVQCHLCWLYGSLIPDIRYASKCPDFKINPPALYKDVIKAQEEAKNED